MGNVIDKTFAILEQIVISSPAPMLPTQLAEELDLNRATCSRLLKQLMDMGYILKVSRQQGYIPGPKLLTMNTLAGFQKELLDCTIPIIDRCADELKTSVLTAQIYHGKRYVLYHKNRNPELDIRVAQPCFDDIFCTATGSLLIAYSSKEEREVCYRAAKKKGKDILCRISSEKKLHESLDKIVEKGSFFCKEVYQCVYAYPIMRNGECIAALGACTLTSEWTPAYHKKVCRTLQDAVNEISRKLTPKYIIG